MSCNHKKIITLLKTAKGQIDGLLKMIEDDRECIDISTQVLATQSILKKVNSHILSNHLNHCIRDAFEQADERTKQAQIDEALMIIEKLMK